MQTKIIRLFAKQVIVKRGLFDRRSRAIPAEIRFYPNLSQFFCALGFSPSVAELCNRVRRTSELDTSSQLYGEEEDALTLELLMNTPQCEVYERFTSLSSGEMSTEQVDLLLIALDCLRRAVQIQETPSTLSHTAASHSSQNEEVVAPANSNQSDDSLNLAKRNGANEIERPANGELK